MGWIKVIQQAAKSIAQYRKKAATAQKQQQKSVKHNKVEKSESVKNKTINNQPEKKAKAQLKADNIKKNIEEKGGGKYPVESVKGHDGSRPLTPGSANTDNSGGTYNPPREPGRSSYRGKAPDKGPSL
jgi:hypothetical protein